MTNRELGSSAFGSPIVPRRRLGAELRRLREMAGRSIGDAARALECSSSKISRLETGKGVPRLRDVRDLIELYGPPARASRDVLLQLAKDGQEQGWWSSYRDVIQGDRFPDHLLRLLALESGAGEIRMFERDVIPGLLQSEEYVQQVSVAANPDMSDVERQRFVEFRLGRQKVMREKGYKTSISCVLDEVALRRAFVDRGAHQRQLLSLHDRLADDLAHVEFRVLPLDVAIPEAVGGPFVIFRFDHEEDQDVVHFEGREGAAYVEGDAAASRYGRIFEILRDRSLSRSASLLRLKDLASVVSST